MKFGPIRFSDALPGCTRRTATVIISAPEASWARTITVGDEYFPVPTIRREENARPAMTRLSIDALEPGLSAADEIDDFHLVARVDRRLVERRPLDDNEIVFDGNAAGVDVQP